MRNISVEEDVKKAMLAQSSISLILNDYDDIFSDFDPRPYDYRALSHDFLIESKHATLDKEGVLELRFLVPKLKRNVETERLIRGRLREHFTKHVHQEENIWRKTTREGLLLIGVGVLMMFFAILFYSKIFPLSEFINNMFIVLTEPAGWFLFWIGGERLVYKRRENLPDLEFYRKMKTANILFISY